MKKILIIGIGAGDPDYLTIQAVKALNETDVFFILDKGTDKQTLSDFRRALCERFIEGSDYRFMDASSPEWDRASSAYDATISTLNRDKQTVFEHMIAEGMEDGEVGAFLCWGDPSLYDSTIRILSAIQDGGVHDIEFDVIPGIMAPQALAAKHKTTLNQISGPVEFTTGRRLAEGLPEGVDSIVVMLDAHNRYTDYRDEDLYIYWGAYIGTPDELLVQGRLADVAADIERIREEARAKHGWIMDTYLLRRAIER